MLQAISHKIQMAYALIVIFFLCRLDDVSKKLHINYSIRGVATIAAVDKLELTDDSELYYIDPVTAAVTRNFNTGYYEKHKLLAKTDSNWNVDLKSFRALVQSKTDPENVIALNREEFSTYDLLPHQARVCLPSGETIVVNKTQANSLIAGTTTIKDLMTDPVKFSDLSI